ncbi:hypothetical protein CINF_0358 [Candidatus Campylobacter infans]|uniref:Uncharacterized protein n=1 Tax=Candidatus Campylobacter infans TaxID=2561898 RepID=A0A7H9CJH0_9BACT|nr:hypothetical protein CINF_0358 [Candidatus Campylobacter infans]
MAIAWHKWLARSRRARCGWDLEWVKNCGGFYNGVAVWRVVVARLRARRVRGVWLRMWRAGKNSILKFGFSE